MGGFFGGKDFTWIIFLVLILLVIGGDNDHC